MPAHSGERASSGSGKSIVDFKSHLDAALSGETPSDDTRGSAAPLYSWMGFANSSRQVRGKEPHTYSWATEITLWKACRHASILRPWARHPHICKSTCVNSHIQVIINVDRCPAATVGVGHFFTKFCSFYGHDLIQLKP